MAETTVHAYIGDPRWRLTIIRQNGRDLTPRQPTADIQTGGSLSPDRRAEIHTHTLTAGATHTCAHTHVHTHVRHSSAVPQSRFFFHVVRVTSGPLRLFRKSRDAFFPLACAGAGARLGKNIPERETDQRRLERKNIDVVAFVFVFIVVVVFQSDVNHYCIGGYIGG